MNISLQDNVIIFDEAHNIEDCIRSATSFSLEEPKLNEAIKSCQVAIFQGANPAAHQEVVRHQYYCHTHDVFIKLGTYCRLNFA
jgi:Rad3-related DNA helicase